MLLIVKLIILIRILEIQICGKRVHFWRTGETEIGRKNENEARN
jgi:hypothetical protein